MMVQSGSGIVPKWWPMTYSLASSSVTSSAMPTVYTVSTSHPKNETAAQAVNIGNLQEQSSIVSVSDQGKVAGAAVSSTFTAQPGDIASMSEAFGNIVQKSSTHFQLFDSTGIVVADNQGTTAQQQAYADWIKGTLNITAADTCFINECRAATRHEFAGKKSTDGQ